MAGFRGGITRSRDEDTYYGVVNIDTDRTYLLIGQLKSLELDSTDVGNNYLQRFAKENL